MTTASQDNQGATKPNQLFAHPISDPFDKILQIADFGTRRSAEKILDEDLGALQQQESEPVPNWLNLDLGPSKKVTEGEEASNKNELPQSPFSQINWEEEEPEPVEKRPNEEPEPPDWLSLLRELPRAKNVELPDIDKIELLGPDEVLDWPFHSKKDVFNCDKAVLTPKGLKPADLPIHDNLVNSARNSTTDWLEDDDRISELPSWLTASSDDDLFAQNGLPQASRNTLPDWMRDHDQENNDQNIDLSEFRLDPDAVVKKDKERFDPNKTQEVKTVKREEPKPEQKAPSKTRINLTSLSKQKKALLGLGSIGLYLFVFNLIGWAIPTGIDNIIIDVLGIYVYTTLADNGYDVRNLLPRKRK